MTQTFHQIAKQKKLQYLTIRQREYEHNCNSTIHPLDWGKCHLFLNGIFFLLLLLLPVWLLIDGRQNVWKCIYGLAIIFISCVYQVKYEQTKLLQTFALQENVMHACDIFIRLCKGDGSSRWKYFKVFHVFAFDTMTLWLHHSDSSHSIRCVWSHRNKNEYFVLYFRFCQPNQPRKINPKCTNTYAAY